MTYQSLPRLVVRHARLVIATTIAVVVAASTMLAQFGTFQPTFNGELWGTRHELHLDNDGVPSGLAFINGTLFVADSENQTIAAFDNAGAPVEIPGAQWETSTLLSLIPDFVPYQLASGTVAVDSVDTTALLVSDKHSNRVAAFDLSGAHLFTIRVARPVGPLPSDQWILWGGINQVALAPNAKFELTTGLTPTLSLTGAFAAGWAEQVSAGTVYSRALVFEPSATFVAQPGEFLVSATAVLTGTESDPVAFDAINMFGVAYDKIGNLYVLDAFTERLNVYGPALNHLFTFGTPVPDLTTAEFHEPWGMVFWPDPTGDSGRLVIGDTYKNRLMVYRPVDGSDTDLVIDNLQLETVVSNFTLDLDNLDKLSIAVDPAQNLIATADHASTVLVLGTFRLTAFNLHILNEDDEVVDSVCTAAPYKVRFSLTVPPGFADVEGVTPRLLVDGVEAGGAQPLATYPSSTLSAGDVVTYTYSLTAPGTLADIELEASATATNTSDIAGRGLTVSLGDCEGDTGPSTVVAEPMRNPQVSGWTPVFPDETFVVTLRASDPDNVTSIAYMIEGVNESGEEPIETEFDDAPEAELELEMPGIGRSTLKYRVRDGNNIWSTWQTTDIRTKLVVNRLTNENAPAEFRVGDPEGVGFTYSVNRVPDGITFSTETGQFAGIPSYDAKDPYSTDEEVASGVYNIVVTEHGPGDAVSDVSFVWTINHINRSPTIEPVFGFTTNLNQPFSLQMTGSDPDGDPSIWTVNGVGVNNGQDLPSTISIDPTTGLISGTFPSGADTEYTLSVGLSECAIGIVSPPCQGLILPGEHLATLFEMSVGVLNLNERADVVNPGPQVNAENDSPTLQIVASDPENDSLTFEVGGLPDGLSINPATGLISGTVGFETAGVYSVTVEVFDGVNEQSRAVTFQWTITNTNRPPVIAPPARQNLEGESVNVTLAGLPSDPDNDTVSFVSITGLPPGLSANSSGVITGTLGYDSAGLYPVTVVVTDGTLQASAIFDWTVLHVNRPPVLTVADQVSAEGDVIALPIVGTDPDGDALTFTMNGLPTGFEIHPSTGVITGTFSLTSAGVYTVNVAVVDGDLGVTKSFTWTVTESNRPPVITAIPDRTDTENDAISMPVIATDPDGTVNLTYSAVNLPDGLSINPATGVISGTLTYESARSYAVTITVVDGSGVNGTSTLSFNWTVLPLNRPPALALPDRQNNEGEAVSVSIALPADPDGDTVSFVSVTGLPPGLTFANGEVTGSVDFNTADAYPVQVVITDGAAQVTTTFVWTINDVNRLPVLIVEDQISAEGATVTLQLDGSDPDGDPLVFTMNGLPVGFTIEPSTGVITGTFDYASAGEYTVNVGLADGPNGTGGVLKTFKWTVTETNRPPAIPAIPDRVNLENDSVSVQVLASDPDGDAPLTYSASGLPDGATINPATGQITGTLSYESAGVYAVTVTVTDNRNPAAASTVTFTWTVNPVNRPPVVSHPDRVNAENDTVSYASTASDPDGDSLSFSAVGLPPGVSLGTNGTLTGHLGYNTAGNYSPTITVSDGSLTGSHTFSWIITNVDAPPVLTNPGPLTNYENETISRQFTATDEDSTNLTFSATGLPTGLTMSSTGLVTGYLAYDAAAVYTVTMTVTDGTSTRSETFTWTVINVNRPPVVAHPDRNNAEGDAVSYATTASDPDGDAVTFTAVGLPPGISINASNGTVSGTLGFNTSGNYTPTITVSDALLTASHTFTWIVTDGNRPPTAVNDAVSVMQGESVTFGVLSNDFDLDGEALSIVSFTTAANGTVTRSGNTFTYTPLASFSGTDAFTYTITDGTAVSTATVTITVTPCADPATLVGAIARRVQPLNGRTEGNLQVLTGVNVTFNSGAVVTGDLRMLGTPQMTINGSPNFGGIVDGTGSLTPNTHRLTLNGGATLGRLVTRTDAVAMPTVNAPPASTGTRNFTMNSSSDDPAPFATLRNLTLNSNVGMVAVPPGTYDSFAANTNTGFIIGVVGATTPSVYNFQSLTLNSGSQLQVVGPVILTLRNSLSLNGDVGNVAHPEWLTLRVSNGSVTLNSGRRLYGYVEAPNGDLVVNDGSVLIGGFAVDQYISNWNGQVLLRPLGGACAVNTPPVVTSPGDLTDSEGQTISRQMTATDVDADDTLTFSASGLPPGLSIDASGLVTGTLPYDAAGSYTVTLTVSDGEAERSVTFTWTIVNVNRPPTVFHADRNNVENDTVSYGTTAADVDGDSLTFSATGLPAGITINAADGTLSGTLGYNSAGTYTPTVTVSDGSLTASHSFTWIVANANRPPDAVNNVASVNQGQSVAISVLTGDSDPDGDMLTVTGITQPAGGQGTAVLNTGGTVTYTAPANFAGTTTFTYTINDGNGGTDTATVTVTVNDVNFPPTVFHADRTNAENDTVNYSTTASDPDGTALLFSATGLPAGISINPANGQLTGSLGYNTAGTHTPTITVSDGVLSASHTFTWVVTNVNLVPDAVNDAATVSAGASININVRGNDTDSDPSTTLTVVSVGTPSAGTVVITGTGANTSVTYTAPLSFTGVATFTYTISDGQGGTDTATVTVTVAPVNNCVVTGFTTYSQGGWGNNGAPGQLMQSNFSRVYPGGYVTIGGSRVLAFTSGTAVSAFLPQGGTPAMLTSSALNPTSSSAGNFAAQVLALRLAVDYSNAGVLKAGLGELVMLSGPFANQTVNQILATANAVLGGSSSALPSGMTVSTLNSVIESLNLNFHEGTVNSGLLGCPAGPTVPTCVAGTMTTTGNSATYGTAGNVRTFTQGDVAVKVSAFARAKSNGAWTTSFLGAFSPGLGVTDGSEGTGANDTHKVDNVGDRVNYLLYEFSKPVKVTKAYLDYIGSDADMTVWVGTKSDPYNNHQSLNDAFLTSLEMTQGVDSSSSTARWIQFNGDEVAGNILVIAARPSSSNDSFKLGKLQFEACTAGSLPNTNNAPTVTVTDRSNYKKTAVNVQISGDDEDEDTLTYSATGLPPGTSINSAGLITGTPTTTGTYDVTVTVTDPSGESGSDAFVWTIQNHAPTIATEDISVNVGQSGTMQASGSDLDNDALTYSVTGLPPGITMSSSGLFTGTLTTAGVYTVTLTVKDVDNATGSSTFTVTVVQPNSAPVAGNDSATTKKNRSVTINVLANDTDPDGDTLTVSLGSANNGTITLNSNKTIKFTPKSNYKGTTTFTYSISDGKGGSDTATVTVKVS